MDAVLGGFDAKIGILDRRGKFRDLARRIGKRLALVQSEQRAAVTLGNARVLACREHHAARGVMLLDRAARMRADLHDEQVVNEKLRANAEQDRGDAVGIGVGQFGQVARAHEQLCRGKPPAQLGIAREKIHEAEMNWIENRIEDRGHSASIGLRRRSQQ